MNNRSHGQKHIHTTYRNFKAEQKQKLEDAYRKLIIIQLIFFGLLLGAHFIFLRSAVSMILSIFLLSMILAQLFPLPRWLAFLKMRRQTVHAVTTSLWVCAASLITYLFFLKYPEQPWLSALAAAFLSTVIGVQFLTAYTLRRIMPVYTFLPLAVLISMILLKVRPGVPGEAFLIFPVLTWTLCSFASGSVERLYYREFRMRYLAERRREKVLEELKRTEQLNDRLEKTTQRLKKEIKERIAIEKTLEQFAAFDELTSVYNRRAGLELLKEALHYAERKEQMITIVFIDLDGLKSVNDNFGHAAGDSYLRDIVGLMKKHLRKSDSISRYGGDEFLVLLTECSEKEARDIFSRIEEDIRSTNEGERPFPLSFSYGMAETGPAQFDTYTELISMADSMMYLNKQTKKLEGRH